MEETKNEEPQTEKASLTAEEAAKQSDLLDRIERTINKIRPYINADGGDVQLIDYKDGVVTVRMTGACAGCMAIDDTLTDGIQAILMDEIPEVKSVQLEKETAPYSYY